MKVVQYGLMVALETVKPGTRLKTGTLLALMAEKKILTPDHFERGMRAAVVDLGDISIDFPNAGQILGESMGLFVAKSCVSLGFLSSGFSHLKECGTAAKLVGPLLQTMLKTKEPNVLKAEWQAAGLKLADFASDTAKFVDRYSLQAINLD